jgi:hypothetical protein
MRTTTVSFDYSHGQVQVLPGSVNFSGTVRVVRCALMGFNIKYRSGSEHPLNRMLIDIDEVDHNGTQGTFKVRIGLRDASGNFDDDFGGYVQVLAIADTE